MCLNHIGLTLCGITRRTTGLSDIHQPAALAVTSFISSLTSRGLSVWTWCVYSHFRFLQPLSGWVWRLQPCWPPPSPSPSGLTVTPACWLTAEYAYWRHKTHTIHSITLHRVRPCQWWPLCVQHWPSMNVGWDINYVQCTKRHFMSIISLCRHIFLKFSCLRMLFTLAMASTAASARQCKINAAFKKQN